MKFYAFVEEDQKLENARLCADARTAFAVAIMANKTNPLVAVRDSEDRVVMIDPRESVIEVNGLMCSEFILAEVDEAGELTYTCSDTIPVTTNRNYILVHYENNNYIRAIDEAGDMASTLICLLNPAKVQNHSVLYELGPFKLKENKEIVFEYPFGDKFIIEGSLEKDPKYLSLRDPYIPVGKLVAIKGGFGSGTKMKFIGKMSSLIKLCEDVDLDRTPYTLYVQDNILNPSELHCVKNPKINSITL